MKKIRNNFYDVYNFLNIINRRLGKLYKFSGYNPLPENFVMTEENMKEVLLVAQMKNEEILPTFINEDKKLIKKRFKTALKNCKYIIKRKLYDKVKTKGFAKRVATYFFLRKELCEILIKDFEKQTIDETDLYREVYNLDVNFGELFECLYENKVNFNELFETLEEKYNLSYSQKLKLIEKKQTKKIQKENKKIHQTVTEKVVQNQKQIEKLQKNTEKTAKSVQKIEKKPEIAQIKTQNSQNKTQKVNKEK